MSSGKESPLGKRHIVITGFRGSGYEEVGKTLARSLGRGVLDTFNDGPEIQALWSSVPRNDELASRLEVYNLIPICDLPPRVVLLRAFPFVRLRAQLLMESKHTFNIFIDTPPDICRDRITSRITPEDPQSTCIRNAAEYMEFAHGPYQEVSELARRTASLTIRPDAWPGDDSTTTDFITQEVFGLVPVSLAASSVV